MNRSWKSRMSVAPLVLFGLMTLAACGEKSSGSEEQEAPGISPKCASFRLLNTSTSQPAVLKVYFQLKTCDGGPVIGMSPEDFVIMEDGTEVSVYESDQKTITDPKSFKLRTVLLVDMSGSILASGSLPSLQQAARKFVSTIGAEQSTAVYAFDGRADLQIVVDFTEDVAALEAGIDSLSSYEVVDKSTNLNGAVLNGLGLLDQLQVQSDLVGLLFAGSLAVFTDGTDQAGRVDEAQAVAAATGSTHSIFTIGLGGEVDQDHLKTLGKDGAYFAKDVDVLEETFEEAADDIKKMTMSYYILAYCSPKRAGSHTLELSLTGSKGAALEFTFIADGFLGGCSPDDFLTELGPCEPNCGGKVCGTDGCGDSCGFCGADESCNYDGTECQACSGCAPWQVCDGAGGCANPSSAGECEYGGQYIASGCFGIDYAGCCTTDNVLYYCDDESGSCPLGTTCLVVMDCAYDNDVCSWGWDVDFFQCQPAGTTPTPDPEGKLYCNSYECIPDCTGKECGNNGCGGSCGTCGEGLACVDGACIEDAVGCDPECDDSSICANGTCVTETQGACLGNGDMTLIEPDDGGSETSAANGCVLGCVADWDEQAMIDCATPCTVAQTGLTESCAECFVGRMACSINNCLTECVADSSSPICTECEIDAGCSKDFEACFGVIA